MQISRRKRKIARRVALAWVSDLQTFVCKYGNFPFPPRSGAGIPAFLERSGEKMQAFRRKRKIARRLALTWVSGLQTFVCKYGNFPFPPRSGAGIPAFLERSGEEMQASRRKRKIARLLALAWVSDCHTQNITGRRYFRPVLYMNSYQVLFLCHCATHWG